MTRLSTLALALTLGVACATASFAQEPADPEAPADGGGEKEGEEPQAEEPESPIAAALARQLHVDPHYRDGRVELVYTFREPEEIDDWENRGFQRAEQANAKGRRKAKVERKNQTLALATSREGILTHKIPFLEDVEVEITCHVERGATRSDLVLGVGDAGVRYGQTFVRKSGSGFKPLGAPFAAENPFLGGAKATVTLKASGAVFSAQVGKGEAQTTDKLRDKLAGKVFLYTTQAHLVVHRVVIRGAVDLEKLKLR
ncbi:MAG: hypothetical protein KDD82_21750 [Planctomycetes bacterium]|nr:hypothetical protein [Planctomycetota bacterium]